MKRRKITLLFTRNGQGNIRRTFSYPAHWNAIRLEQAVRQMGEIGKRQLGATDYAQVPNCGY